MAKVTITLTDDVNDEVVVRIESDPGFPVQESEGSLTLAQSLGMQALQSMHSKASKITEEDDE